MIEPTIDRFLFDLMGFIAYGIVLIGTFLLWFKIKEGWILRLIGNIYWAINGYLGGFLSIFISEIIFVAIDIGGFIYWRIKKENQQT